MPRLWKRKDHLGPFSIIWVVLWIPNGLYISGHSCTHFFLGGVLIDWKITTNFLVFSNTYPTAFTCYISFRYNVARISTDFLICKWMGSKISRLFDGLIPYVQFVLTLHRPVTEESPSLHQTHTSTGVIRCSHKFLWEGCLISNYTSGTTIFHTYFLSFIQQHLYKIQ